MGQSVAGLGLEKRSVINHLKSSPKLPKPIKTRESQLLKMARTKSQAKKNAGAPAPRTVGSVKKSQFNMKQKSQSPFSAQSQAKKMKVKTTQKKSLRKNVPKEVLQENTKVAALEKQIKAMQDKIRLIEKNQRQTLDVTQGATRKRPLTRKMAREGGCCLVSEPESSSSSAPRGAAAGGAKPKKKPALPDDASSSSSCRVAGRKRKSDETEDVERRRASKVAYIFCGEGGERDLVEHLRRASRVQILSTESLPDIDASDLIHGLDPSGTSRDVEEGPHRCTESCPAGCDEHLRANEITIYESIKYNGKLFGRKRIKGRFVGAEAGSGPDIVSLDMWDCRLGGRGTRRRNIEEEEVVTRRFAQRLPNRRRARLAGRLLVREPVDDEDVPPPPATVGQSRGLPQRLAMLMDSAPVSLTVAREHGWNANDKSFNIVLKDSNSLVMRRLPIAQSTDCVRTKVSYSSGLHQWEVTWPVRQRGTHSVVGVGTSEAPLHAVGYQSLLGNSAHSWGWDLGRLKTFHDNQPTTTSLYPSTLTHQQQWTVPDIFTMILDMDRGSLGFAVGDQFLGWTHHGLKSHGPLFPMVSTVWGQCEVKLRYLGGLTGLSLQDVARTVIRDQLGRDKEELEMKVDELMLPTSLKNFIKYH